MRMFLMACCAMLIGTSAFGQAPKSTLVDYMMSFNSAKDGKLTKEQLTDRRLHRLFTEADADNDGVVTVDELKALSTKLEAAIAQDGGTGKGGKGPPPKPK